MFNPYHFVARSNHPFARVARKAYWSTTEFTLPPLPKPLALPLATAYRLAYNTSRWPWRVFVVEPLFKAMCRECGEGVRCDTFLHHIEGQGDIYLGDRVLMDGKSTISFAAHFSANPTLRIGAGCVIGHDCVFQIAKSITLGSDCRLASGCFLLDSNGHPLDAERRRANEPPGDEEVRPVTLGDNVWLGRNVTILPGVTVGDNAVIGAGSVVTRDVAANTLVAGNPARVIMRTGAHAETAAAAAAASKRLASVSSHVPQRENGNGSLEGAIISIVQRIGKLSNLSPEHDFYDAGFSSLNVLELRAELEETFDTTVPDKEFIEARTVSALARILQTTQ